LWNDNSTYRYRYINGNSFVPGTYKVFVNVTNADHCIGTDTVIYTVVQDIAFYNDCLGRETIFYVGLPDIADSVYWDFGDGNSMKQLTARHTYVQAGSYYVTSIIYSNLGTDTITKLIGIIPFPDVNLGADITISPNSILTLDAGTYDTPVYYSWEDYSNDQYRYISGNNLTSGTHIYIVRVSSRIANCMSTDTIKVTIDNETQLNQLQNDIILKQYPNPVQDIFYIENPLISELKVIIYDVGGNTIGQCLLVKGQNRINMDPFLPGIYILHFPAQHISDIKIIKY
jgi:hypothetical protein